MRITACLAIILTGSLPVSATASPSLPKAPILLEASDLDPCSNGVVTGLKAQGDGFLSVRSAPATASRQLARLFNGRALYVCATKGEWLGVVYGKSGDDCGVTTAQARTRRYAGPCDAGWVHRRWVEIVAG